jgi:NAD(P)-dependent dehydrogenase (short-subunit alcohol dehydrogenase family)
MNRGAILVTGASRGIGAAIALSAAAEGFSVAVNFATERASAETVVEKIVAAGGRAFPVQADVSREEDILRMFAAVDHELGPITALVNNAAITGGFSLVENVTARAIQDVCAVNIVGAVLCAREAVRRMSTKHGGSGGAIVNLSSLIARVGGAGEWVHYAVSKGAVNTFTIGLAREVAADGIRVNAVAPGLVDTEIHARNGDPGRLDRMAPTVPMKRAGTVEEVAAGVMWLLSSEASYVTGSILEIGGGR